MDEENRINMSDSKDSDDSSKDLPQQLDQQASDAMASQDPSAGEGGGAGGEWQPSVEQKVQEAMSQGQESGLLSSEQLQDDGLQEKVKEATEKGQAPSGFLNSTSDIPVRTVALFPPPSPSLSLIYTQP